MPLLAISRGADAFLARARRLVRLTRSRCRPTLQSTSSGRIGGALYLVDPEHVPDGCMVHGLKSRGSRGEEHAMRLDVAESKMICHNR